MYGCGLAQESSEVALDGLADEFLSDDFIERDAAVQVGTCGSRADVLDWVLGGKRGLVLSDPHTHVRGAILSRSLAMRC